MRNHDGASRILAELAAGPLTSKELFHRLGDVYAERETLSKTLYNMKARGELVRDEERRYHQGDKTARAAEARTPIVSIKHETTFPSPSRQIKKLTPKTHGNGSAAEILEKLLGDAQRALEQYAYTVGDKAILDGLVATREAAYAALKAYRDAATR
jgi:hypothetical protein